eukprot:COSAG06_NODE_2937_length_6062_cov_2.246017_5_plen_51_part_00
MFEVRKDLGGMAAMRKGVEKIHKMGAGTSFFIPFYTTKPDVFAKTGSGRI